MKFTTLGKKPVEFEIEDEWLIDAGVYGFKHSDKSYHVLGKNLGTIPLINIVPPAIPRLHYDLDRDKEKIISILIGFKENVSFLPIHVIKVKNPDYDYEVHDGFKRFYCSVIIGFTEIPVTIPEWL